MVSRKVGKALLALGLLVPLLVGGAGVAQAAPAPARAAETQDVGVLGGCDWSGCGTASNGTGRGFHVTINWGAPWNDENVKWVRPYSTYGLPQWVDVDGVYVGQGCRMVGFVAGRPPLPHPPIPISWGPGWHKITNNQTAAIGSHTC